MKNEVEQIALQNDMSIEFVTWFFNEKKVGCGNVWFMMMAAMWEGWKGCSIEIDKLAAENVEAKKIISECREYFIAGVMNRIRPTNEGYLHMICDTFADKPPPPIASWPELRLMGWRSLRQNFEFLVMTSFLTLWRKGLHLLLMTSPSSCARGPANEHSHLSQYRFSHSWMGIHHG